MYTQATDTILPAPRIFEGGTGLLVMQRHPELTLPDMAATLYPETVIGLHRQYVKSGADTLKTLTFNANPALLNGDIELCRQLCLLGVEQCRAAGAQFVAGDIGCVLKPDTPAEQASSTYQIQAAQLIDAGADLLLIETIYDIASAHHCLTGCTRAIAASGRTIPLYINAVHPKVTADELITLAKGFDCYAAGWNCSEANSSLLEDTARLKEEYPKLKTLLQPDGTTDPIEILAKGFENNTIDMAGGCCGTTPETISRLSEKTKQIKLHN